MSVKGRCKLESNNTDAEVGGNANYLARLILTALQQVCLLKLAHLVALM
jgi:hypothetical protein